MTPTQISNHYATYYSGGSQMTMWDCKEENVSARECPDAFVFPGVLLELRFYGHRVNDWSGGWEVKRPILGIS